MSGSSDDAKAVPAEAVGAEAVAEWLKRNPGFLNDRPDVMAALLPPEVDRGDGVVDMQRFMLERLRRELSDRTAREKTLLSAAKSNADVQARVHGAARALLKADSLETLISTVTGKLPKTFDIAAAALCVESNASLPEAAKKAGVILLPMGTLDDILGPDRTVALRADIAGDERLFGKKAKSIRSAAVLRLDLGGKAPRALLVLGARAPDGFDPRQGTELLSFFAHVLQHCLKRWLGTAP